MRILKSALGIFGLGILLAGCGGGGSSPTSGGSNPVQASSIFVADDMSTGFDHIWVTIKKVVATDTTGATTTLYNDTTGTQLDLTSLGDSTGSKYSFLNSATPPTAKITKVSVTLDGNVNVFPTGSTTAHKDTFGGLDSSNNKTIDITLATPETFGDNFVIDFDLKNWTETGSVITGGCKKGDTTKLTDPTRHVESDFAGTVSSLTGTAPAQSFTITTLKGGVFKVALSEKTSIFNNDGSPNPTLANGEKISLRGLFDPASQTFNASSIKIQVQTETTEAKVAQGAPSNIDSASLTFDMSVKEAHGFLPNGAVLHIVTSKDTMYLSETGRVIGSDDFFTNVASAEWVQAEGTYDGTTQTLTAKHLRYKLDVEDQVRQARGTLGTADASSGAFTLKVFKTEGIYLPVDTHPTIYVVTDANTQYFGAKEQSITKDQFFAGLTAAPNINVEGIWNASAKTLTAARLKLDAVDNEHGAFAWIAGATSNVDATAKTFTVTTTYWRDIDLTSGATVSVTTDSKTEYRDQNNQPLTADQFFSGASTHKAVVFGTQSKDANGQISILAASLKFPEGSGSGSNGGGGGNSGSGKNGQGSDGGSVKGSGLD